MSHQWHTNTSHNPLKLINEFRGFTFKTDYNGTETVTHIKMTNRVFPNEDEARSFITRTSYGGETAYMAIIASGKQSKAYKTAYDLFLKRYQEYMTFGNNLTIAYGRKALRVTCPSCESSITLKYGNKFKACPVCGSTKIISDSNWKILETKERMAVKAAENLETEAIKNNVLFICGIEWHC